MAADNWDEEFETPIPLPSPAGGKAHGSRKLVTLRDAGRYIEALPKRDQDRPEWRLATKDLLRAATDLIAWRWFARRAIMKALYVETPPAIGKPTRTRKADAWREKRRARKR